MTQPARPLIAVLAVITVGCGPKGIRSEPLITADPTAAISRFMEAVRANDLQTMGSMWGTRRGLAANGLNGDELTKRLTVIRIWLNHETFEVIDPDPAQLLTGRQGDAHYRIRFVRQNRCTETIPVTLVPYRSGWLVENVNIERARNPAQACERSRRPPTRSVQ